MMYADYIFYTARYYGNSIDEADFNRLATRASDYIDYITLGKAAGVACSNEAVKKCCCALAETFSVIEKAHALSASSSSEGGEVASETVGSHSRSFRSGAETAKAYQEQLMSVAGQYLLPLGLLYRGGVPLVYSTCCHGL